MSFKLDDRLASDSILLARLDIIQLRMSKDSRYPWLILVPEVDNISELHELTLEQQTLLLYASNITSLLLERCFSPDKLNVACLGNIVKQLHVHHVARFEYDVAWPGPIWGFGKPEAFKPDDIVERKSLLIKGLQAISKDVGKNKHLGNIYVNYNDK